MLWYSAIGESKGGAGRKHLLAYKSTFDGFMTWKSLLADCEHDGGSLIVTIEKLKMEVHKPFTKWYPGGLFNFVDYFQTNMEELGALNPRYADNKNKLDTLITALRRVPSETSYYLDYIQNNQLGFAEACAYLRERAMLKTAFDDSSPKQVDKASQSQDDVPDGDTSEYQKVFNIMRNWASETNTDLSHVYAAMNVSNPYKMPYACAEIQLQLLKIENYDYFEKLFCFAPILK